MIFKVCLLLISVISDKCIAHEGKDGMKGFLELFFINIPEPCNCKCGIPNREARLLGGEYTKGHEFPWLAQIQVRDEATISGTLINNRYVLTSASEMIGLTPYDLKVTLGQFDRCFPDVSSQVVSVESVTLHPDFSPGNRANDLALIKLSAPVQLERRIRPICLPTPGKKYLGQVATVAGWNQGPDASGIVSASCRPRKLGLPVLGDSECKSTAFNPAFTSSDKACIGIIGVNSVVCGSVCINLNNCKQISLKDTPVIGPYGWSAGPAGVRYKQCWPESEVGWVSGTIGTQLMTDAGGPVMYRTYSGVYELIGVLSDTNDCSDAPSTALYTIVNDHLRWIKDLTKDSCYCYKS